MTISLLIVRWPFRPDHLRGSIVLTVKRPKESLKEAKLKQSLESTPPVSVIRAFSSAFLPIVLNTLEM
ncbi:hypothetical protein D3C74_289690 [compost metagenome]